MKQIHTIEEYQKMSANEIRKNYKSGTHIWRCIDDCIALINHNEEVRNKLQDCKVIVKAKDKKTREIAMVYEQQVGEMEYIINGVHGTYFQQIKAIAFILNEDYSVVDKACWSMKFKGLLKYNCLEGNFNPYMAMGEKDKYCFNNVWNKIKE